MDYEAMANEELAVRAQEGDIEAENVLYEKVYRLIYKLSQRCLTLCGRAGIDEDDLIQECWIGFHNAVMGYQTGRGMFSTYLGFHVKTACMRALNIHDGKMRVVPTVSIDTPVKDGEDITIADMIADESIDVTGGAEITDLQRVVRGAVARLTKREQELVNIVYVNNQPVAEFARAEGISPERARQLQHKMFRKLERDPAIQAFEPYYMHEDSASDRRGQLWDAEFQIRRHDDHEAIERRIDDGISLYLAWCSDNSIQPDIAGQRRELVMWEAAQLNKT